MPDSSDSATRDTAALRDNADLPPIKWRCSECGKDSPPFATWREVNAWQEGHECHD